MAQTPPKADAKEVLYSLQSKCHGVSFPWQKLLSRLAQNCLYNLDLIPEFTSLFSTKVICAGLPAKAFPRNQAFVDISVFLWLQKQRPSFAQGQPKGYFQLKELHRTTKAYSQMNADWKVDKAQDAEFNLPTCGKIAVWQLCRERQPWWNSHDGPELKSLDQCHGVRSHCTSSSQGWRKMVVQSKFDPWVYIRVLNTPDLCRFT